VRPAIRTSPTITVLADPEPANGLVLVLHGGRATSRAPTSRWQLAYRRMLPFGTALRRAGRDDGLAVWMLRYRYRGWNGASRDPVPDTHWALERVRQRYPRLPVVLVGHSMGGRAALYVAGDPSVIGVCALAPWIEDGDPVGQLAGRSLLIAHGDRERTTDPRASYRFAVQARRVTDRVCRFDVIGDGHTMLRRAGEWVGLVCRFVLGELGMRPVDPEIAMAMVTPAPAGLRTPLRGPGRSTPPFAGV
jgi:pimeloyl-ACP methyl ester carboxylesterase